MQQAKAIIWTISGSDCSGGAGIAADIKTGQLLGVEVCHLITANTVQNSTALLAVNEVPTELLQAQVQALIVDKPPAVIKIGLLASLAQVSWLSHLLAQLKQRVNGLICVYDPVGQASVGGRFSELSVEQLTPLLTQIDIITPNLPEAKMLASCGVSNVTDDVSDLAKQIHHHFNISSVIITGGHSEDNQQSSDYCYHQLNQLQQDNQDNIHSSIAYQLKSTRINTHFTHGSGCSFASALSAFLAKGYLVRDAFTLTKAFINQGLAASQQLSVLRQHQYYGAFEPVAPPFAAQYFPTVHFAQENLYQLSKEQLSAAQLKPPLASYPSLNLTGEQLGLYPVIDSLYWLERLLSLGLNIIQLRIKNLAEDELSTVIKTAVALASKYQTRLFINDYWQLAIEHGAYGVHIGQEDLAAADLQQIRQAGLRLGISTHGCYEFLLAQQLQPSYLAIGAIFPTKTKDMTGQIQGLENLTQILTLNQGGSAQAKIPVVAIGGINIARAPQVIATGVDSIAVVTAITEASDPEQAVKSLVSLIE